MFSNFNFRWGERTRSQPCQDWCHSQILSRQPVNGTGLRCFPCHWSHLHPCHVWISIVSSTSSVVAQTSRWQVPSGKSCLASSSKEPSQSEIRSSYLPLCCFCCQSHLRCRSRRSDSRSQGHLCGCRREQLAWSPELGLLLHQWTNRCCSTKEERCPRCSVTIIHFTYVQDTCHSAEVCYRAIPCDLINICSHFGISYGLFFRGLCSRTPSNFIGCRCSFCHPFLRSFLFFVFSIQFLSMISSMMRFLFPVFRHPFTTLKHARSQSSKKTSFFILFPLPYPSFCHCIHLIYCIASSLPSSYRNFLTYVLSFQSSSNWKPENHVSTSSFLRLPWNVYEKLNNTSHFSGVQLFIPIMNQIKPVISLTVCIVVDHCHFTRKVVLTRTAPSGQWC